MLVSKGVHALRNWREKFRAEIGGDEEDTFLRGIRPLVILGQMFGMFPIDGIVRSEPAQLGLKWFSFRVLLNLTVVVTALLQAFYEYQRLMVIGINAKNVSGFVFFIDACLINVLFLNLATVWRSVAIKWDEVDRTFNRPPFLMVGWSLRKRLVVVSFTLLILSVVEHCLSVYSTAHTQFIEIQQCNWTVTNQFQHYALRRFAEMYLIFPYHNLSAVFFTYVSTALTIYWNYQDIFIICISIGIATRFQQINNHLKMLSDGVIIPNEDFWIRVRTHYVSVCELLDDVDRAISWTMLISCATNLYYICLQILHVSQKLANTVDDIYYWFSLMFLLARTVTVFLSAAHIHDCAKKPLEIIMKIPNVGWCVELERFAAQLKSEKVALSGMGFFSLTRQLLFSMAGTIVTYELVMLKFDEDSENKGHIPLCSKFPFEHLTASDAATDPKDLHFRLLSIPLVLSVVTMVGGFVIMIAALVRLNRIGFNAINSAEPIFFGMCALLNVFFVRLAILWGDFMTFWSQREELFFARPYGAINLRRRVVWVAVGIIGAAIVEHAMSVINHAYNVYQESLTCRYNVSSPIKLYAMLTFRMVYPSIPYNHLLTIYLVYTTIALTFIWTFTDLFIMLVSTSIGCRFGQLNKRIDANRYNSSEAFWGEMRAHFVGLMELVERANRMVGPLVIASCANDVYFLCLQTLNTVENKPYAINEWYFRYSFLFLIVRTTAKLWCAAEVNEESLRTHKLVQTVQSEQYNDELEILRICSTADGRIDTDVRAGIAAFPQHLQGRR
ncbi:gustatory receptor for sugar taste 64a-like [Anopheles ziemanni]|uniref:gustatory receptor for sugar taste 64a-like n=1 Tax=Anopheles coustani TaxID=139045 RepID=UPI002658876C|nr:gustatory receptor for sugar taste 64a-like [Anopheles coustani]XP_058169092.1 gustatory receptor for sugar taste 64a-like [Anopheles ziemanni]